MTITKPPNETGAEVFDAEISALTTTSDILRSADSTLASAFNDAVARICALRGRLIVTGMGKSGHIARKIAATFSSTGTPASFVHPAEASHGDLGMIAADDLVLALSLSGETAELRDIIAHAGRFNIPLVAITGDQSATLALASRVVLAMPAAAEATDAAPAPTTSTTMMLAMGDALAIAVLREKGFTKSQFRDFHPGGKLGAALMRATDLMHHKDMPLCAIDDRVADGVATMSERGFGCIGVLDRQGRLKGIVTDGDLRRQLASDLMERTMGDVMTEGPHVVSENSLAGEVLSTFSDRKITAVFIVDEERRPVGLVHIHDCLSTGVV